MADDNKKSTVTQVPLMRLHKGECQGVVRFGLFLTSDENLRGEGVCSKCGATSLNCSWPLQRLMESCPPPLSPPVAEIGSDPAVSFEELLTNEDRITLQEVDRPFR